MITCSEYSMQMKETSLLIWACYVFLSQPDKLGNILKEANLVKNYGWELKLGAYDNSWYHEYKWYRFGGKISDLGDFFAYHDKILHTLINRLVNWPNW